MSEEPKKRTMSQPTLCWDCANATGGCRWSKRLKPVEGWEIIPTRKSSSDGKAYTSCIVIKCPEFKQDAVGSGLKRYRNGMIYTPTVKND